ncbi:MAG: ROK family protein [Sphingomonas sp.]|uniref:ROK family protein n=1 Tax=Sphingomonas sp. TaxID=28214 RepID=UPI00180ABB0B|nr:ROK family protein [Sphingomonas sp.]MBA3667812.1 ROK family protein [Sphingomonas sp.]
MTTDNRFAAIEAGGTKVLCAIAGGDGAILAQCRIATRSPEETFADIDQFFGAGIAEFGPLRAGGIGSFGPLDLDPTSSDYGSIITTPKPGWSSVDILGRMVGILGVPTAIDTDVNCAAIAEARHGAGRDVDRLCYVTVGTGIGVGVADHGVASGGAANVEAGHSRVPRARDDEAFAGICSYHADCLEGLASGPALKARWGAGAESLDPGHEAWAREAHYIACLCVNLSYTLRPQRIILGGGVLAQTGLYAQVRAAYVDLLAGYALDAWNADAARFICAPTLVDPSPGLTGAIDLARDLYAAR